MPVISRGTSIELWQEPNGYWSALVVVRIPDWTEWRESATGFHTASEALNWTRERMELAVAARTPGPGVFPSA